ncbi:MAG TPA: thiolase family protein [Microlunatus sp.]|nr:thiolase family protein [Microlunatus sp.]
MTIAIVAARRTPIGTAGHGLATVPAAQLAAAVLPVALADAGLGREQVADVVLGNCTGPGGDLARYAALQAGLGPEVPGLTVDRQCGSGLAAVEVGAALLSTGAGAGRVVLAGGVESASTSPRPGRAPFAPAELGDPEMGEAADHVARRFAVSRRRQDAYALRSHRLASAAQSGGLYDAELVGVGGLSRDERPRADLTPARLARMRPAFTPDGTATAGNSCGINDGAAVVALMPDDDRAALGLPGLRIVGSATSGVSPRSPGIGLVPAVRAALDRAAVRFDDIAVVELNEAFAGQVLACCDQLDLDPERVCVQGGAIALGHPWGASGAVLLVRLFSQLVRTSRFGELGLAAIAVGGGQGVAMVVQACR